LGEKLAQDFLRKNSYRIIETNYRCPVGEIDIISSQKGCLVFVEVRTKRGMSFGTAEESISVTKQNHMKASAFYYLQRLKKAPDQWRIDVLAVSLENEKPTFNLIENAVPGD